MLNTNECQRKRSANKDEALKIALEIQLMRSIKPLFRKVGKELQDKYKLTGLFPSLVEFEEQMQKDLINHYKKVSNVFSQRIVNELGKPDNHDSVLTSISARTASHHPARAKTSTASIVNTTRKDMSSIVNKIVIDAAAKAQRLSRDEIAKKARVQFNKSAASRANIIAMTETQNPAEHAKQAEIDLLDWHNSFINGKSIKLANKKKKWIAILDTRTRHAHAMADGLVVDFDKPYTVNGQLLMYPGDTSLGATLDNIINCRCSSVIIIR